MTKLNKAQEKRFDEWVDREGIICSDEEYKITKQHLGEELARQREKIARMIENFEPSYNFQGEPCGKTGYAVDKRDLISKLSKHD